jgi:NitT/TauT family transport system permease protein
MTDLAAPAPRPTGLAKLRGPLATGARRLGSFAAVLAVLFVLWQAALSLFGIPAFLMPAPPAVAAAFAENLGAIGDATLFTLACTLAGMAVSVVLAIGFAIAFVALPRLAEALMPVILIVRAVPMIAVAPLIILIFGRGAGASIGIVALLTYFQIMLAAWKGFLSPSESALELMRAYGAGFWQTQMKVRMPFAVPFVFTGLRIAAGSAILCAMFAEWLSGAPGLGSLILDAYSMQRFAVMWAGVLTSATVAYCFLTFTIVVEQMVLDWSR